MLSPKFRSYNPNGKSSVEWSYTHQRWSKNSKTYTENSCPYRRIKQTTTLQWFANSSISSNLWRNLAFFQPKAEKQHLCFGQWWNQIHCWRTFKVHEICSEDQVGSNSSRTAVPLLDSKDAQKATQQTTLYCCIPSLLHEATLRRSDKMLQGDRETTSDYMQTLP